MKSINKIVLLNALVILLSSCSNNKENPLSSRSFNFSYSVEIPSSGKNKLEIWIPIPSSNQVQKISNLKIDVGNLDYTIKKELSHGNQYIYIYSENGTSITSKILINFNVKRNEHKNIIYDKIDSTSYLDSYSMVPVGDIFSQVILDNNLSSNNIRGVYNFVLNGMHYGKPKESSAEDQYYSGINPRTNKKWLSSKNSYGLKEVSLDKVVSLYKESKMSNENYTFGNGNSIYACDIGVGNCTDYHSYFISLNRTLNVPTRFHMGFPISSASKGNVSGYHCWADYYIKGEGWYPVDISEADKNPSEIDYYFGTICENRLEISVGRDLFLDGHNGGPVNLFIYPILEINDMESNNFTKTFTYKDN